MNEYKSDIEELYEEIGEIVYQKHVREEDINIKEDIQEYCKKIDELSEKVKECRMEILNLKDKKQCEACYSEIEKDAKFCPKCGNEQPENNTEVKEAEFVKEAEVLEDEPDENELNNEQ